MAVNKLDPKVIFASTAPTQDTPAAFPNKTNGWGESRKNGGRPTIKQMNALQQETDLKILWLNENAVTPYDATIDYPNNAVVIKDGTFKILDAGVWKDFISKDVVSKLKTIPTYYTVSEGVDPVTGVAAGAYFNVRSSSDESYIDEYQNVGGVPTPTGKTYPSSAFVEDVKNNTAYFYPTISQMVAATNLVDGAVVATKGYHNIYDGGGATYLISSVATDYSIPLENSLHAVFRDTFDIRKFGIQDNVTLDQTEYFQRMANYADSRVYEIDFHNFEFMTPSIPQFTTSRGTPLKGLGFNHVHHLKNFKIVNDKTKALQQGECQILFLPKSDGAGTFKLSNAKFDPLTPTYNIVSGEYDGLMIGFLAEAHPNWAGYTRKELTGYNFDLDDVEFLSPAVSYNVSLAAIRSRYTRLSKVVGEHWGLYVHVFTQNLLADNSHGVFRDDLHTGSGRLLVTNFIHEEPEITGSIVTQDTYNIRNCSCRKKTDGSKWVVYKNHALGSTTIDNLNFDNCVGTLELYGGADINALKITVNTLNLSNAEDLTFNTKVNIGTLNVEGVKKLTTELGGNNIGTINMRGKINISRGICQDFAKIGTINADTVVISDQTYGFIRAATAQIDNINIDGVIQKSNKLIECSFKNINISNLDLNFNSALNNLIFNRYTTGDFTPVVNVSNFTSQQSLDLSSFIAFQATLTGLVSFRNCKFPSIPQVIQGTFSYFMSQVQRKLTYDPPSLAAAGTVGDSATTNVAFAGAVVGDNVSAAFSTYNAGVRIYPVVSAANVVTVEFRNISAAPIDLASGTLTVKLI